MDNWDHLSHRLSLECYFPLRRCSSVSGLHFWMSSVTGTCAGCVPIAARTAENHLVRMGAQQTPSLLFHARTGVKRLRLTQEADNLLAPFYSDSAVVTLGGVY